MTYPNIVPRKRLGWEFCNENVSIWNGSVNPEGIQALEAGNRRVAEWFISVLKGCRRVIDIGCGTGFPCLYLAPHVDRIVGVDALLEPIARVDTDSPLRWTCKSTRNLEAELKSQGLRVSHTKVGVCVRDIVKQEDNMSVDKTQHPIFQAVKDGDLQQVKCYLAEGIDVDIRDKVNSTPLSWASSCGHLEMVKYLAEHGADINSQYDAGNTPLIVASWQGHLEVVQYLVDIGADIHIANKGGCTALSSAAEHGHLGIVKFLVEHGADVNTLVLNGGTALTAACEWGGDIEVAKYLISKGADLEVRADCDGFTPLVAAAYQGHTDLVKFLIACGADIHVDHGAPLEWAALFDQFGTVDALLDAGADPDEKLGHDNTALISAASERPNERVAIMKALLDSGSDVNGRGASGVTALHEAAASGRLDIVELLLESGADIALEDDDGNTAVLRAAEAGQIKVLCLLAKRGADLDHSNKQGKTAREILSKMMLSLKSF